MFTGREALFSIEQAISRVRADEGRLDAALRSAMDEAARLRREEANGFRVLARVRLDTMMREQVIGALDDTERRAVAMIESHREELDALARRRAEQQAALDKAEAAKHDCDQDLADALEALDEKRQRTAERIQPDPAWRAARAAVEAAEKIAANADQKASQAEADLSAKGKPYEDDPLFIYLWSRKHGEAGDRSSFLVRFFDRQVAQLVGYRDARANYAMLREIPLRLREHAKNKQGDVETAKARVAEVERQALVTDGIEPLEAKAAAAQAAVADAGEAVVRITAALQAIEADREKATGAGDDAVHGRAADLLAETLAREDLRELYQEAMRTPTKADDKAIAAISAARKGLQQADGDVAQIRAQIRDMAGRRGELEGARDRARSVGYHDPRGTFGGSGQDVLGQVIGGVLGGMLSGGALDRVLRDNYQGRREPRVDPGFGGHVGGPSWPGTWTGGGGGDRGGSDGWRTGGGF
jgi:hypothetical protein